ncbi:F-box/LRR-repeat protein At4g14103-like [Chenopodium quinoa]|uniref:F-box/LRR-repeat protein At4g14103-like n=1 Tax=Chenopodium quinoa TaxID=63459 RepID=UPI000B7701E4|nr:F-box/LRR-repeat protein At4g14103-like [Chenopodium quinoa]
MDMRLKRCTSTTTTLQEDVDNRNLDRLTCLSDELLIYIISSLPTKDAAAACASSKRMITNIFHSLTHLNFDDSPISHCSVTPYAIERFPTFVAFVDSVLQSYHSRYLTSFSLGVGAPFLERSRDNHKHREYRCCNGFCPDLKSTHINAWISFPLTFSGLKELNLRIHVREEGVIQLPPEVFKCETLEILKLDTNLGLDQASTYTSFRLPSLKLLSLHAAMIPDDGLVTRLVSSCPILEDLTLLATWKHACYISISSPSLRRLSLEVLNKFEEHHSSDLVLILTPNLEYLYYGGDLASHYNIINMDRLVKADLVIENDSLEITFEVSGQVKLSLLRPLSNVQHLTVNDTFLEELNHKELKDQLPVFCYLKCLELGFNEGSFWDSILLGFLNRSPVLETLVFPEGLTVYPELYDEEELASEQQFCRTALVDVPTCCRYHLKKIVIKNFLGYDREIDLIQFFLTNALVLENLVLYPDPSANVDQMMTVQSTLQNLPRASVTCSIQVV